MKLLLCLCVLILPNFSLLLETDGSDDQVDPATPVYIMNRKLPPGRIIGGEEVTPHAYPFQAAVYIYSANGNRYFCGGTLISRRWVLTAAHCLDLNVLYVLIYLGSHNITADTEEHRTVLNSTIFHFHPRWNPGNFQYDIGLVKLPTEITLDEYVDIVTWARSTDSYANQIGNMVGWGLTETSNTISPVLRSVNSTILSNQACNNFYGIVIPHHICSNGAGTIGTCNGDSGGPLLVDGIQVGITSWGASNCLAQYPSVFTRITEFENWIDEYVESGSDSYKLRYSFSITAVFCLYRLFVHI